MLKAFCIRVAGLLCAAVASIPASIGLLKGIGPMAFGALNLPLFKWATPWVPAVRYPMHTLSDFFVSLPGLIAIGVVGAGIGVAFFKRKKAPVRRWEDER